MLPRFLTQKPSLKTRASQTKEDVFINVDSLTGSLAIKVRRNARARRYTLRISNGSNQPVITIPNRGTLKEARAFAQRHSQWLASRLSAKSENIELKPETIIPVRGVQTLLRPSGKMRGTVELQSDDSNQDYAQIAFISGDIAHFERRATDWLKREAKKDLEAATAFHAKRLDLRYHALTVRDQKTRWGSCSSAGNLNYSWRLILAPPEVLDYVAAHEVAHLQEMNHGPNFWALVEQTCPDMNLWRKWLKKHGPQLHLYG